jgi:hypothetical protein
MTYPPPLYHGDSGEINAVYRPAATEPELVYRSGTKVHYLSTGASTGGHLQRPEVDRHRAR